MTISSATSEVSYTGNGATSVYAYTFRVLDDDDIVVKVRNTASPPVETTLTKTTDYTVSGVGDSAGGNITLVDASQAWLTSGNLTTSYVINIKRNQPRTQSTDIRNQGSFLPETHEDQFDRLVAIDQTQQSAIDRSLKLPDTETPTAAKVTIPDATTRASKTFIFDASGNPSAGSVTTTAMSAFMATVADDTTWYGAQNTLGFDSATNIVAAGTTDLGNATGNYVTVTHASGTVAITSLGGASMPAGTRIWVRFSITGGTLTMTHDATNLALITAANLTLATGDMAMFVKNHDSNAEWRMAGFHRVNGAPLVVVDANVTDLAALTTPASDDHVAISDTSATTLKKITLANLVTGHTAETAPASGDEALIYDASATALRKMTLLNLLTGHTAETAPASGDEVLINDISAVALRKMTLGNLVKFVELISGQTAETSVAVGDEILINDVSAGALRRMTTANLFAGFATVKAAIFEFTHTTGGASTGALSFTPVLAIYSGAVGVTNVSTSAVGFAISGTAVGAGLGVYLDGNVDAARARSAGDADAIGGSITSGAGADSRDFSTSFTIDLDVSAFAASNVTLTWASSVTSHAGKLIVIGY